MSARALSMLATTREVVLESLARLEGHVEPLGPERWRVMRLRAVQNRHAPVLVTLDGEWLAVTQTLPARATGIAQLKRWGDRALDARLALPAGVRPVIVAEGAMCRRWSRGRSSQRHRGRLNG